ncbi:MAG TPA: PIN domain-containing protein [Thermosynergistes sp.]|nr:PIN domain-containing protein [Thermosynergistes sp.]
MRDMIINAGVQPIALSADELENVISAALRFNLDFDDAYQYAVAQRYRLRIISFDADFDRTERGRRTPQEVLS